MDLPPIPLTRHSSIISPVNVPEGTERHKLATSADTCILRKVHENPPAGITRQQIQYTMDIKEKNGVNVSSQLIQFTGPLLFQ